MPDDARHDVAWIAQRHGQDWRDEDILTALAWLEGLVSSAELSPRIAAAEANFQAAKAEWAEGRRSAPIANSIASNTVDLPELLSPSKTVVPSK
jgi:hypothetical protein